MGSRCTWAGHTGANSGWGQGAQGGGHTGANREDRSASSKTDLRVNVANCFTKSRPAALAHWPANELFQTLRAPIGRRDDLFRQVPPGHPRPIGRRTNCFRRSALHWPANELFQTLNFWARTVFKDCYFSHYLYTLLNGDRI